MRNLLNAFCIIGLFLGSANSLAGNFEVTNIDSYSNQMYPNLDINNVEQIIISTTESNHVHEQTISRIEFVFPFANNLVATNFSRDGNVLRATVNGAWVYKQVLVEIYTPYSEFTQDEIFQAKVYVVENTSNLDALHQLPGIKLFESHGRLNDVTPKKVADEVHLNIQGKPLTLTLYQRPMRTHQGEGFIITANWLGHGEKDFVLPAPSPSHDFYRFTATTLVIENIVSPNGDIERTLLSVRYTDDTGYVNTNQYEELQLVLDREFPPMP